MMSVTEKTFLSNAALTEAKPPGNWTQLNRQLAQAKVLLREMRETVADIEDARTIERAKRATAASRAFPGRALRKNYTSTDLLPHAGPPASVFQPFPYPGVASERRRIDLRRNAVAGLEHPFIEPHPQSVPLQTAPPAGAPPPCPPHCG